MLWRGAQQRRSPDRHPTPVPARCPRGDGAPRGQGHAGPGLSVIGRDGQSCRWDPSALMSAPPRGRRQQDRGQGGP